MSSDVEGGVWPYSLQLAGGLVQRGHPVDLVVLGEANDQHAMAAANIGASFHTVPTHLEWMDDPWQQLRQAGQRLQDLAAQIPADLVHLNHMVHGHLDFGVPTITVGHSCVLSWFEAVRGHPAPPEWAVYRREVRRSLRGSDVVIAPSRTMADALEKGYGIESVAVVHNSRDPRSFKPADKARIILGAGRLWDPGKNLAVLRDAAMELDWPLQLAGPVCGPSGEHFDGEGFELLGNLSSSEMAATLGRASIFAAPARYEPFGLGVLEAALCGCALVLADIPSFRELWSGCALFVAPDRPDQWQQSLTRLIADPEHGEVLASKARKRALRFSPQAQLDDYEQLYQQLHGTPSSQEEARCAS